MVENKKVNINLEYNWGMAGCSRGQGVRLRRGLNQLGTSSNPNNGFINAVACTGLLARRVDLL